MTDDYQRSFTDGAATERARLAAAGEMTERDAWAVCDKVFYHLNDGDNGAAIDFIRAFITEVAACATVAERERCAKAAEAQGQKYVDEHNHAIESGLFSLARRNALNVFAAAIRAGEDET